MQNVIDITQAIAIFKFVDSFDFNKIYTAQL
jgi:hypothetical protein